MNTDDILLTAHIHLENATFRVHVPDAEIYPVEEMNDNEGRKPAYVNYISRSNDPTQRKQSLLVNVCDDYSLEEIANWIKSYEP